MADDSRCQDRPTHCRSLQVFPIQRAEKQVTTKSLRQFVQANGPSLCAVTSSQPTAFKTTEALTHFVTSVKG